MSDLVRRGTAKRLGLRPADPLRHYRQRWAVGPSSDLWESPLGSGLWWSATFPASGPEVYIGETRLA